MILLKAIFYCKFGPEPIGLAFLTMKHFIVNCPKTRVMGMVMNDENDDDTVPFSPL